jgi:long-chain acyl-CoA synthetase
MTHENHQDASPLSFLSSVFAKNGALPAFIFQDKPYSYSWLVQRIQEWDARLEQEGIRAGSVVAITGDYSPEICSLLLALIQRSAIAVPFASVVGAEKEELMRVANVQFEFLFEKGAYKDFKKYATQVENDLLLGFRSSGAPGLIVFSSGSTGVQKGILHDFSRVLDKFRLPRKTLKTLTFLQLDHLGGINTLLYVLSNGGTVISLQDRSPKAVAEAVEKHKIELLPVTPSFLNLMIVSGEHLRRDLSSLQIISYGTEVMPEATLEKVKALFPAIQLQQTYGLSELGVLRTKSRNDGSLWVKVGGEGFETKVVDNLLWIKAHSAMVGYLNAPQPFDSEGWFNTGDQVEVDGDYLRILGRKSDLINVGGQKVFPSEVESVLIQMDNVRDAAVRGEKNFLMGNIVVARLSLEHEEDLEPLKRRVREFCKDKLSSYKIPVKVEVAENELVNQRFKKVRKSQNESVTEGK